MRLSAKQHSALDPLFAADLLRVPWVEVPNGMGADRLGCCAGAHFGRSVRPRFAAERQPGFHRLAREADGSVVEATPEATTPARPPIRLDRVR